MSDKFNLYKIKTFYGTSLAATEELGIFLNTPDEVSEPIKVVSLTESMFVPEEGNTLFHYTLLYK